MRRSLRCFAFLLVLSSPPPAWGEDGKLAEVREDVRQPPRDGKASVHTPADWDPEDNPDDAFVTGLGRSYWKLVFHSFALPAYFPCHPYADDISGYIRVDHELLTLEPTGKPLPPELLNTRLWSCRLSLEEGNDFDGLNRIGGQLLIDTSFHLGCVVNVNYFHERLKDGRTDDLTIGDVSSFISLARCSWFTDRIGGGLRFLTDDADTNYGANILYGFDLFPTEPIVVSCGIDGGTVGRTFAFHLRGTIGGCWSHGEAFIGYDFLRVGDVNLQGPLVGLRLWF